MRKYREYTGELENQILNIYGINMVSLTLSIAFSRRLINILF